MEDVSAVVIAACALHNLAERMRDPIVAEWEQDGPPGPTTRSADRRNQHQDTGSSLSLIKEALSKHFAETTQHSFETYASDSD